MSFDVSPLHGIENLVVAMCIPSDIQHLLFE
jgi:hypothetical protein